MKLFFRRSWRKFVCSISQLFSVICRPLFFFCFLLSLAPGVLLSLLLGWKAIFYPAAMPQQIRFLFLPVWTVLSCGIPALCASIVLAIPARLSGRMLTVTVPICTMHLLLAFLWALFLLYHLPPLFCLLCVLICAISGFLSIRYASRLGTAIGSLMLLFALWNGYLVFLSAQF